MPSRLSGSICVEHPKMSVLAHLSIDTLRKQPHFLEEPVDFSEANLQKIANINLIEIETTDCSDRYQVQEPLNL